MSGLEDTMTSIYGEVNRSRTPDATSSHGLVKVECYSRIKELTRSHEVLKVVSLE